MSVWALTGTNALVLWQIDDDVVEDASDDEKKRKGPDDIGNDKLIQVTKKGAARSSRTKAVSQ